MGQRMPPGPIEYGDDCLHCFAAGKTPKYVWARFSQILQCPDVPPKICGIPPNDRVWKLTQDAVLPCWYQLVTGGWILDYTHRSPVTHLAELSVIDPNGRDIFYKNMPACQSEGTLFHNAWIDCIGWNCGHLGFGIVTWTEHATAILELINMEKAQDLFMELHPRADGKLVYKFCRLEDATNIKILFEP